MFVSKIAISCNSVSNARNVYRMKTVEFVITFKHIPSFTVSYGMTTLDMANMYE